MSPARTQRLALAAAAGTSLAAYLLAFTPYRAHWLALAAAVLLTAAASAWRMRLPAAVERVSGLAMMLLLVTVSLVVVFSRQLPLIAPVPARRAGAALGGALGLAALVFLSAGASVSARVMPALLGVLVAAGMDPDAPAFVPLACCAGAALWGHAESAGGPRRPGLALVAWSAVAAGLAAGIIWFLPLAQPKVVEAVARAYGEGRTGLSDRSELGEVASLAQSSRLVARVWTTRAQPLRMQVFTRFDGHRWLAPRPGATRSLLPADRARLGPLLRAVPGQAFVEPDAAGTVTETRIVPSLSFDEGWGALAPADTTLFVWPGETLGTDALGLVRVDATPAVYGAAGGGRGRLAAPPDADDLALFAPVDPRVQALARTLAASGGSDRERVARTVADLRARCRYTLAPGRFRTPDPLAEFLFDHRAGYCEYFATAAVVLLRLQGIPARYVKGVAVRAESRVGDHHVVREWDAHAWVDAWIAGEGWVEADPTPADGWAQTHAPPDDGVLGEWFEGVRAALDAGWATFTQGTWPWLVAGALRALYAVERALRHPVVLAALLVGLPLLYRLRRRRRRPRPPRATSEPLPPALADALARVERHWSRRGHPRPPACGFQEHLDRLDGEALTPDARAASRRVVETYHRCRFGGHPLGPAEVEALRRDAHALDQPR